VQALGHRMTLLLVGPLTGKTKSGYTWARSRIAPARRNPRRVFVCGVSPETLQGPRLSPIPLPCFKSQGLAGAAHLFSSDGELASTSNGVHTLTEGK
jgi:hypothetical protein